MIDSMERAVQQQDELVKLALSEMFKECLWCHVSGRINVGAGSEV